MTPADRQTLERVAVRVLASPQGCRVVMADTEALAEIGDAGVDALLQLPGSVQLLVTDLAAQYEAGNRLLARLLAHPRVQRLDTAYGRLHLEVAQRAQRYLADAQFRADWEAHYLPALADPGPPERGTPVIATMLHLAREEPPGPPTLLLVPESHFEAYGAREPACGPAVIAATVLAGLLLAGLRE